MTFCTQRRVEFRDTDAAGLMHFSAFFPMMEAAEHEMFRSLGLSVMPRRLRFPDSCGDDADRQRHRADPGQTGSQGDGPQEHDLEVTWPRVAASCSYKAAAHFEDLLEISVQVAKLGNSSVRYHFRFTRDTDLIAEGEITTVCCRLTKDRSIGGLEKVPIPEPIRQRLATLQ